MSVIKKTFEIDLDLKQPLTNYEWRVVAGDTGNVLVVTLTDGGTPVDLTDARLIMLFSRGTSIAMQTNEADDGSISVSGTNHNIITVDLRNGSFAPGLVESYLQIYSGYNPLTQKYESLVTTAKFNFRCDRELFGNEYIMSLDSYSILTSLISEVQEIISGRVQADWSEDNVTSPQYIKNKPTSMAPIAHASTHATGGTDSITPSDIGAATSGHAHGNITNAGALQTTDVGIANGDKLVVTDSSNSGNVARTSTSFDGSTTTKALTPKGTFETFYQKPASGIPGTDLASSYAASSHTHGSITNAGAITGTTALASGDGLVFADSSDSSKLKRSSNTFDGSTESQFLTKKGTFVTPYPTGHTAIVVTNLNNACHSTNNRIEWYAFNYTATNSPGFSGCCFYMSYSHPWGFQVAFSEGANKIAMRWKNHLGEWGTSWLTVNLS